LRTVWSPFAASQLTDQLAYLQVRNPAAADRMAARTFDAVDRLLEFPEIGRPGQQPGTRELPVDGTPYVIVYEHDELAVYLLRFWHGRQDWKRR
jgi:plasmid stabilization system protein ParE